MTSAEIRQQYLNNEATKTRGIAQVVGKAPVIPQPRAITPSFGASSGAANTMTQTIAPNPYSDNPQLAAGWNNVQSYSEPVSFAQALRDELQKRYDDRVGVKLRSQEADLRNKLYNTGNDYYAQTPGITALSPADQQSLIDQRTGTYIGQLAAIKSANEANSNDIKSIVSDASGVYNQNASNAQNQFNLMLQQEQQRQSDLRAQQQQQASLAQNQNQFQAQQTQNQSQFQAQQEFGQKQLAQQKELATMQQPQDQLPLYTALGKVSEQLQPDIYGRIDPNAVQQYNYIAGQLGLPDYNVGRKVANPNTKPSTAPPVLPELGPDTSTPIKNQAYYNLINKVTDVNTPEFTIKTMIESGEDPQAFFNRLSAAGAKPEQLKPLQDVAAGVYGKTFTPQSQEDQGILKYQQEKDTNLYKTIDSAVAAVNDWNTGAAGGWSAGIPGTPAYDLDQKLQTIKANLFLNELKAMKSASANGSTGLGALSDMEGKFLAAALGSLNTGMNKEDLKNNLLAIKASIKRWKDAGGDAYMAKPDVTPQVAPSGQIKVFDPKTNQTYILDASKKDSAVSEGLQIIQ